MPILGIVASSIQNAIANASSYESIATATGNGSSGTITFSSIPSTYKHLQIRLQVIASGGGGQTLRFNGDTGSNYTRHYYGASGASTFAGGTISNTSLFIGDNAGATYLSTMIVDILDYTSTTKYKTVRSFFGYEPNSTSRSLYLYSGLWLNTSAVSSISLGQGLFAGIFDTGTVASLYGIKG